MTACGKKRRINNLQRGGGKGTRTGDIGWKRWEKVSKSSGLSVDQGADLSLIPLPLKIRRAARSPVLIKSNAEGGEVQKREGEEKITFRRPLRPLSEKGSIKIGCGNKKKSLAALGSDTILQEEGKVLGENSVMRQPPRLKMY